MAIARGDRGEPPNSEAWIIEPGSDIRGRAWPLCPIVGHYVRQNAGLGGLSAWSIRSLILLFLLLGSGSWFHPPSPVPGHLGRLVGQWIASVSIFRTKSFPDAGSTVGGLLLESWTKNLGHLWGGTIGTVLKKFFDTLVSGYVCG